MSLKVLCEHFDALERAGSDEELRTEMGKFATAMGFDGFAYVLTLGGPTLKSRQHVIHGFPDDWVQRYMSKGYDMVDPIAKEATSSSLPIIWDDHLAGGKGIDAFWEDARSFGLLDGLTFSVQEKPGIVGMFSLSRDKELDLPASELAALIGRAQIFAVLLHHAVSRVALPQLLPDKERELTARERECLKWAADGKTAWEIGRILSITERTAVFHLTNVTRKLGATNRTQAVVRAVTLRLV